MTPALKKVVRKATVAELKDWLKIHDLDLWLNKTSAGSARRLAEIELGKIQNTDWSEAKRVCKFYGKHRRRSIKSTSLSAVQWGYLREAVLSAKEYLGNKSIEQASAIVSVWYPCNAYLLEGLSSDLHFWASRPLTKKPFWLT